MTPKEKAIELVDKFQKYAVITVIDYGDGVTSRGNENAKICALIAVREILELAVSKKYMIQYGEDTVCQVYEESSFEYWEQVKEEINKL